MLTRCNSERSVKNGPFYDTTRTDAPAGAGILQPHSSTSIRAASGPTCALDERTDGECDRAACDATPDAVKSEPTGEHGSAALGPARSVDFDAEWTNASSKHAVEAHKQAHKRRRKHNYASSHLRGASGHW